jgi:hypothetical protein
MDKLSDVKEGPDSLRTVNRPRLIQNAIRNKFDKLYYHSNHVHDFVTFPIDNSFPDSYGFIDGGCSYVRTNVSTDLVEDYCLFENSTDDEVFQKLLWGTYGKSGKEEYKLVLIKDCTKEHLEAILKTQQPLSPLYTRIINRAILTAKSEEN